VTRAGEVYDAPDAPRTTPLRSVAHSTPGSAPRRSAPPSSAKARTGSSARASPGQQPDRARGGGGYDPSLPFGYDARPGSTSPQPPAFYRQHAEAWPGSGSGAGGGAGAQKRPPPRARSPTPPSAGAPRPGGGAAKGRRTSSPGPGGYAAPLGGPQAASKISLRRHAGAAHGAGTAEQ
jgi:hypothetical protein